LGVYESAVHPCRELSAAEEIAGLLPGATPIKAFNTTFAGTIVEGQVADHPLDVFVAGD